MNERIWKVLQHRATKYSSTAVLGFTAGAMFGYWRTKSQYQKLDAGLNKVEADTERLEQLQFDFKDAAIEAEVNRRVKSVVDRMNSHLGYNLEDLPDEESLIALRQDHSAFDDEGQPRIITSAKIHSVGLHTDGNGLSGTGVVEVTSRDDGTPWVARENRDGLKEAVKKTWQDPGEPIAHIDSVTELEDGTIEIKGTAGPGFEEAVARTHNIFDQAGDEWDYKTEIEQRDRSKPYVIHVDEYVNDEMGWDSQSTLTYYEEDDILTDSHDTPIYNYKNMTGELRFGHGSNDPNVVYIRNEKLEAEYEILRDPGSYEMTVLGERMTRDAQIDELKHSATPKFRRE